MLAYPKVWRHNHPLIENLLITGDIHLLEKIDGSNFRFFLYDTTYEDEYPDLNLDFLVEDGDIIYGTKSTFRATIDTPLDDVDGNFWRAVRHLRNTLDTGAIRDFHDAYGPLLFYAENMVCHSLDYNWEATPPLLGFDIYAPRRHTNPDIPFNGFLPLDEAKPILEESGVEFAPVLEQNIPASQFNPDTYEVPDSQWRDGQAEGVVIRNDTVGERGKLVTSEFKERNADRWGKQKTATTDDTELLVATYCTNARIRKNVHNLLQDDGLEFSKAIIEPLYKQVVDDIWSEEWPEITRQDWTIEMKRVWSLVAKRCAEVVEVMHTNATLNNAPPESLWQDIE